MSRFAILWFCCAMIAGALLFQTSQRVTDGRQRLENITAEMRREEDSLRVLQAEWSYLNQPERLEKLAAQYLKLAPMKGRQFVAAANLPLRPALADETSADLLATVDQAMQESLGTAERATDDTAAERAVSDTAAATVLTPLRKPAGLRLPAAFAPPAKTEPPIAKKPAVDTAASHRSFGDVLNSLGTGSNP